MRLLFAGTPAPAVPSLEGLIASRHDVVAVLTRPDAPSGRGRTLTPSPVRQVAEAHGIEVLSPRRLRDEDFRARFAALAIDAVAVVAYGALIPTDLLAAVPDGWTNLHFSLLPAWRGAAPVQHALIAGDEVTGATTFRIEEGPVDTGPVYGLLTETIRPRDTAGDLLDRLAHAGAGLLVRTMDGIADGTLVAVAQGGDGISHAPKLTAEDGRVRWTHPAHAVDRRIRGCTPEPGAWTTLPDGTRLGLGPVTPVQETLPAGAVQMGRRDVLVGTGSTAVRLGTVSAPGRRTMPAADWARGARLADGTVLGAEA
ncbi:methionyl-tRNA formyltransferase [Cellulomonas sp. SG140]|uniref:methionyl-tRNA formyltransferase n=1 Tax=Cellulomonas sp. SG140 TaxID=2976536 RepID=UPI0021E83A22|nr:methionyl-tRNA formyltransferase [Cellulomonas sp. SG140]